MSLFDTSLAIIRSQYLFLILIFEFLITFSVSAEKPTTTLGLLLLFLLRNLIYQDSFPI